MKKRMRTRKRMRRRAHAGAKRNVHSFLVNTSFTICSREAEQNRPRATSSIYFASLKSSRKNHSIIEKELLAIIYCVNHVRPYFYGHKFTLVTANH